MTGSLRSRVARFCAVSCALAGLGVALVTGYLSGEMARRQEDAHLIDAARTFAFELLESPDTPAEIAADETRELEHTGIGVAVVARGRVLAGDQALGVSWANGCQDLDALRACSVPAGAYVAVAARSRELVLEHRSGTWQAALIAVVAISVVGALLAFLAAGRVTAPLARLRTAVENVPIDHPGSAELGANEGLVEVDALRGSMLQSLHRLGSALDQSRNFAAEAAHQLRTPLTAILGELELAQERGSTNADEIARARRGARRLSTLIERLLILAHKELELEHVEEIRLAELIEETIVDFGLRVSAKWSGESHATVLRGDRELLREMLANGLDNAIKFSEGAVVVELACSDQEVSIAVVDSGPGIADGERERVFAPFYRVTRPGLAVAGHGIGLSLIASIVSRHNGRVRFAPSSKGARLEISLPRAVAEAPGGPLVADGA